MARARKYRAELLGTCGAGSRWSLGRPITHVGRDLGIASEMPRKYVRRVETDDGRRKQVPT